MNSVVFNQTLYNKGQGPVVILLNGLFGNYRLWSKTVTALQDHYHVVVPRLPIFEIPAQHSNLNYLVEALHSFIEWHKFKEVTLVGHAMGGQIALLYSYFNPEKVSNIVISGSTGIFESPLINKSLLSKEINKDFVHEMVSHAFYEENQLTEIFAEEIYLTVENIPNRLMIGSLIKSSIQNGLSHSLNEINTPTLLLWGLEDKISPPETALHFHDFLRYSELRFIKECGHVPMIEQPEIFNQHLISFLGNKD
ncbi:MAG: alpha/beta hydrolase [Cyclobacteriaceae bacterium]